jgi:hypothetical protein
MIGRRVRAYTRFLVRYWEAMYLRADPPEDSEAELALLRDRSSAHCSDRRSMCGTGAVSGSGRLPLPSCVTLVVRRLRTHAGHPKSCDHIS